MAYLQDFKDGEIHKERDKYIYRQPGKSDSKAYHSVEQLVKKEAKRSKAIAKTKED